MSYIIGSPCVSVCDMACVKVCPVDCIHGPIKMDGAGMEVKTMSMEELVGMQLYINPFDCINCGACIAECPVDAIYEDEDEAIEKDGTDEYVKKNYSFFGYNFPEQKF
jgi:NAD-dependent dihydropyrimidine dehydrogenase PreA subunit